MKKSDSDKLTKVYDLCKMHRKMEQKLDGNEKLILEKVKNSN